MSNKPVMTDEQELIILALRAAASGIGAIAIHYGTDSGHNSDSECLLKQLIKDLQATFK